MSLVLIRIPDLHEPHRHVACGTNGMWVVGRCVRRRHCQHTFGSVALFNYSIVSSAAYSSFGISVPPYECGRRLHTGKSGSAPSFQRQLLPSISARRHSAGKHPDDVNRLHGLRRQRFGSRALSRPAHQRRVAKVNSVRVKCPAQRAYIRPCCAGPCLRCDGTPGMHFLSLKRVACPTRTTCGPLPLGNPTPTGSATCVKMTGTLCVSRRTVAAIDVGAARMTSSFCWRYVV
jgi:hypothetical protein